MKKFLIVGGFALAMIGCKTATNVKNDVPTQIKLKGEWTLTNVSYPSGYKITSFHVADAKCFEGSQWKFVSNNNTGTVSLNTNRDCPEFSSNIVWNIKQDGGFNLKFIGSEKAKHVTSGYNMYVTNLSDTSFQLVDSSTEATITYTFVKNSK